MKSNMTTDDDDDFDDEISTGNFDHSTPEFFCRIIVLPSVVSMFALKLTNNYLHSHFASKNNGR